MELKRPIFIVSSERSGTNLLRVLLDNHSKLHGPRAPQLLATFVRVFPHYLITEKGIDELIDDIAARVNHPFIDWGLNLDQVRGEVSGEMSLIGLWDLCCSLNLSSTSKQFFVCKENALFDFTPALLTQYPDAKFIYLHRDPRDVCASWMKVPNGFKNVSQAAQKWNQEQLKSIMNWKTFGIPYFRIPYEELVTDTPGVMTRLLRFLDLEVEAACFDTDKEKGQSLDWNEYWKNLGKGVMRDNTKKYLKELSTDEIMLIETRSKEAMKLLGYERETSGEWVGSLQPFLQRVFSRLAFKFEQPRYRNKQVTTKDQRQSDFANGVRDIEIKRYR